MFPRVTTLCSFPREMPQYLTERLPLSPWDLPHDRTVNLSLTVPVHTRYTFPVKLYCESSLPWCVSPGTPPGDVECFYSLLSMGYKSVTRPNPPPSVYRVIIRSRQRTSDPDDDKRSDIILTRVLRLWPLRTSTHPPTMPFAYDVRTPLSIFKQKGKNLLLIVLFILIRNT